MPQPKGSSVSAPEASRPVSFDALYAEHARQVLAWAARYSKGRQGWAEDLAHDVFLQAWNHRAWLREADVKGWLYRVTQNLAFSTLRRENRFGELLQQAVDALPLPRARATPDESLEHRQALAHATKALDALPGQERVVMVMKTLDGLSQREIAHTLSLSEGYVSKLLARAQAKLQAQGWATEP